MTLLFFRWRTCIISYTELFYGGMSFCHNWSVDDTIVELQKSQYGYHKYIYKNIFEASGQVVMLVNGEIIEFFAIIYFIAIVAFLLFVGKLPRVWRLVGYGALCGITIFISLVFRIFDFITLNCQSGERAQAFFETLQQQLTAGTLKIEYLEIPGCSYGVFGSIFALLAVIGGGIMLWFKPRWYSWLMTFAAIILSSQITALVSAMKEPRYIIHHNALRQKSYTLIEKKLAQKISHQQLVKAIQENLKDFRYTYENLNDEKTSSGIILTAIENLQPGNNAENSEK